ncbi:MAG: hypothetical protein ACLFV3_09145 [Phycisphaeraceae bacterium]
MAGSTVSAQTSSTTSPGADEAAASAMTQTAETAPGSEATPETPETLETPETPESPDNSGNRRATPAMFNPDPSGEEEPAQMADSAAGEDEAGEQTDRSTTQPAEGEDGDGEAGKPHQVDVGLQKLQQRQAAFERQFSQLNEQVTTLLDRFDGRTNPGAQSGSHAEASQMAEPTAGAGEGGEGGEADQFETLLTELGELQNEAEGDDFEFATTEQLRQHQQKTSDVLSKLVKAVRGSGQNTELQRQVQQLQDQIAQQQQAEAEQAQAEQYWSQFEADHGFDGRKLWDQAQDQAESDYPEMSENELFGVARAIFDQRVQAAKKKPSGKTPPASRHAPRSTEGTQTVPDGATAGRPAKPPQARKPRMHVPD